MEVIFNILSLMERSSFFVALISHFLLPFFTASQPLSSTIVRKSEVVRLRDPNAQIQGLTYTFENGFSASSFLGIRYAKPPINELRFKPSTAWSGIRDASQFGHRCFYVIPDDYKIKPSEDCLFLNVFTPKTKFKGKFNDSFPVIFYIHGGAFQTDNSGLLGDENICRYLTAKEVVVVTINYRLQMFGFLAIDDKTPGNIGLWDQREALLWVRKNIEVFGGDVNRITVVGQSAGSVSTDLFTLSPHTRELFSQAMMFAGTSDCTFTISNRSTIRTSAIVFAEERGFQVMPGEPPDAINRRLLKFYQNARPEDITIGWNEGSTYLAKYVPLNTPTIDGSFLPYSLKKLRTEAPKKNFITGVTEYEGLLFMGAKPNDTSPYDFVKGIMTTGLYANNRINSTIADDILSNFINRSLPHDSVEFYHQSTAVSLIILIIFMTLKALSDYFFNYPTWCTLKRRAELGENVYAYRFTYFKPGTLGNSTIFKFLELPYFFGKTILPYEFVPDDRDKQKIDEFTTYLTNFVKTGDPNDKLLPKWTKFLGTDSANYFVFSQNSTRDRTHEDFGEGRFKLWDFLYKKYGLLD
ncbi:Carboxylic ester hydrolase [Aphelenchoides besseyi]|nr:Carboxylic ester hydrolase [Aphelenchoides besseyi]KAI6194931.1 Carboxylic ester hydrolase [Aphelenchoides besseyi]